ncbi:hypothetical protein SH1V18_43840 [Vallitalea longa]|uniref:Potassium channel domain-containing protein n=1 Tax=Vallitalea longa TaxID=2936439 RepID=A0A9W5YF38_9FIRM|nr:potassium channel family protein [Vallitalea longa]GKX31904.1 hypothetical protein SH1V18_43840 [Vallitalea longa]
MIDCDERLNNMGKNIVNVIASKIKNNRINLNQSVYYNGKFIECFITESMKYCKFINHGWINCSIFGLTIEGCEFENFIIEDSNMRNIVFKDCKLDRIIIKDSKLVEITFINCNIYELQCEKVVFDKASFLKCYSENSYYLLTKFMDTKYIDTIHESLSMDSPIIYKLSFVGKCKFNFLIIMYPKILDMLELSKDMMLDSNTYIDKFHIKNIDTKSNDSISFYSGVDQIKKISMIYYRLYEICKINNINDLSGDYFYLYKQLERMTIKRKKDKFISFVNCIVIGYGEKPFRTLGISAILVIVFASLYLFCGLQIEGQPVYYGFSSHNCMSIRELVNVFGTYLHFSIVTFTTVGYGNIVPIGLSRLFTSIEMILGVVMIALFTGTLLRKMTK